MSGYPMSPPVQQPAPLPYAYPNAASPQTYGQTPPAKRQRLSPDARSPVGNAHGYPPPPYAAPSMYGNPYAPQTSARPPYGSPSTYAGSPQAFNSPQYHPQWSAQSQPSTPLPRLLSPPQIQNSMPPPPRPNKEDKEERMNIDEIGDSLYGSGVSIKEEENYLLNAFSNRHAANDSFTSTQNGSSFNSSQTMSPRTSFTHHNQSASFGNPAAFAGTLGAPQTEEQIEAEIKRKRAAAARSRNEALQHPMANQFLQTNGVRKRLMDIAAAQGVTVDTQGLWQRQKGMGPSLTNATAMMTSDGREGIVATVDSRPEFTASKGEHFEQVMSLLCVASGERMRGLVEDAFAVARARQLGDHGRVPSAFTDVAVGPGEAVVESAGQEGVTGTPWDRPAEEPAGEQTTAANGVPKERTTIAFPTPSPLQTALRSLAARDAAAETARLARRRARQAAAAAAAASADPSADPNAENSGAENGAIAPVVEKVSKKEQARKEKEAKAASALHSQATTNATAAQFAIGRKKN
ncbi:hypothetical protein LTR53_008163, partial [Teratosphaeriaceae sp. CCFEE 6253]